jgi:hypothetical protein
MDMCGRFKQNEWLVIGIAIFSLALPLHDDKVDTLRAGGKPRGTYV